ncbi:MAG: hypothetical protein KA052_03565 [Candidatus Pacebacteria bacterium]|nr:hypothetical protein [Candidatus Paceibacterota bacterium]
MKSLKTIGKDVLIKIFPETVEFGFKSKVEFFDHTLDIHRRVENIYSNISRRFQNKNSDLKPYVVALKFGVWGMELGIVDLPFSVIAPNKASDNKVLDEDLIDLICKCDRIKQTSFSPTHLVVTVTAQGNKWEQIHREVYYLEKWQSDEIVNSTRK